MERLSKLNEQLLKIRHEAEDREAQRRAHDVGVSYLDAASTPIKVDALKLIPEEKARRLKIAIIEAHGQILGLAALDPKSPEVEQVISGFQSQGMQVKLFAASLHGLERVWGFYKFIAGEKSPITSRVNIEKDRIIELSQTLTTLNNVGRAMAEFDYDNALVTEFLEIALSGAMANRASDIHFEPAEKEAKIRYRIDGVLHDVITNLRKDFYTTIISRVKLLSNLKINIQDRSQDGRFTIGLTGKDIEMRVAIAPSEYGEIIVMRILDPDAINITLPQLGLRPDDLEIIQNELKRPNGMVLNTGPTGSGKTTTLYAFLRFKHNQEIKIITIEDPIEYHLSGIEQTQVNKEAGYTFADGLRSIMRQDPDVILVGEVRDKETAEIAIQAALTGHLVFSTIHANEAAGAIPRFLDLGVKATSIGPALNLIIAQRLVRRLCDQCKVSQKISLDLKSKLEKVMAIMPARVKRADYQEFKLFQPKGCPKCMDSGYKGRVAIFELLVNDPEYQKLSADPKQKLSSEQELESLIARSAGVSEILNYALKSGMVTLQQDGILKVISGTTTFEEVAEVTGPIKWG